MQSGDVSVPGAQDGDVVMTAVDVKYVSASYMREGMLHKLDKVFLSFLESVAALDRLV